jgi:carbamoyl-phosphate synthase small subunit
MTGYLVLADKTILPGQLFGFPTETSGEVVFSTGMIGYPETLTDPSFKDQILVFTYPLIGNYGLPQPQFTQQLIQNFESEKIQVKGIIVTYQSDSVSHWSAKLSLSDWLKTHQVPGLAQIDTRFLTQKLRHQGTMPGKILLHLPKTRHLNFSNPNQKNLVAQVSCPQPIIHGHGQKRILLIDCGVKASIIRCLLQLKTTIIQVPWNFDPFKNKLKFDAVVISNGPGDPQKVTPTITIVKKILRQNIPTLGICLGNQILALAAGGQTYKLKYGHRSQNQPCLLVNSHKAFITSQNHGFAVRASSLTRGWKQWFINLNDNTNEGIIHQKKPFAAIQFHPEANPGPEDTQFVFDQFLSWIR